MAHENVSSELRVEQFRLVRLAVDFRHGVKFVSFCIRWHVTVPWYFLETGFELFFASGFERVAGLQLDVLSYPARYHQLPE